MLALGGIGVGACSGGTSGGSDAGVASDGLRDGGAVGRPDSGVSVSGHNPCSADGWCWDFGAPPGRTVFDVHGTSRSDIWAVGAKGLLLHYNGSDWEFFDSPTSNPLLSVFARSENEAWAVGAGGTILRWDGMTWVLEDPPVDPAGGGGFAVADYWSVKGTDDGALWVAGEGYVFRRSGSGAWVVDPILHQGQPALFRAVAPLNETEGWAAGTEVIARRTAEGWIAEARAGDWRDFHVLAETDIWLVGGLRGAAALRWDGAQWWPAAMPPAQAVTRVWSSGPDDAWAVGNGLTRSGGLTVLHWNGTLWSFRTVFPNSGDARSLFAVWGTGPTGATDDGEVWLMGQSGFRARFDSTGPSVHERFQNIFPIRAGLGFDAERAVAVGGRSRVFFRTAEGWRRDGDFPDVTEPYAVWGVSEDDLWVADREGAIAHRTASGWDVRPLTADGISETPTDMWGSAADDIWVARIGQDPLHWNGAGWRPVSVLGGAWLRSVYGTASDDFWGVTENGEIVHFDGVQWSLVDPSLPDPVAWVRGSWFSGEGGVVLRWNGTRFDRFTVPVSAGENAPDLARVWSVGPDYAVVVEDDFTADYLQPNEQGVRAYSWDGNAWARFNVGFDAVVRGFFGSESRVWAFGDEGNITVQSVP